jgi:hypothetical protein
MTWDAIAKSLVKSLREVLDRANVSAAEKLDDAFNVVAAYQAARLKPLLVARLGTTVQSGPFAGMRLLGRVSEGAYIPKLLGSYEAELHPFIEEVANAGYDAIINIGCAEGYYAVGLARRANVRVYAFDIDERARQLCLDLAQLNDVRDRVCVGKEFHTNDFARYAGQRILILCDIEGAELSLLDPTACPVLRDMDLLIEIHRAAGKWTSDTLFPRFEESHIIAEIAQQPRDAAAHAALSGMSDADRFFALLERVEPTRWAFLKAAKTRRTSRPTA